MVNYAINDFHFDEIVLQYYDPKLDHQASEPEVMIGIAGAKAGPFAGTGQMHCEFTFNAGASNAAYNTAATSWNVANKDSEETDYIADDIVHWVLTDADTGDSKITALAAGDSFEILAIYESAADPDGETNAKFRVIEVEYI